MNGKVTAVSLNRVHLFSKSNQESINLLTGIGVEGDAHAGATVKHRSRVARDLNQPNLRQVHLIHAELHNELKTKGYHILPGQMGENITTRGIDLLGLPTNTRLFIGEEAVIQVTGLRNPCTQLNSFKTGLMTAVLDKDGKQGNIIRKAGIMSIVIANGVVRAGDNICIQLPPRPYRSLERV
jgi:MOSC domain-containing protein YiiM